MTVRTLAAAAVAAVIGAASLVRPAAQATPFFPLDQVKPGMVAVGRTIFQTEPTHKVTEQFRALAREFEERMRMVDGESQASLVAQGIPQPEPTTAATTEAKPLEDVVNG